LHASQTQPLQLRAWSHAAAVSSFWTLPRLLLLLLVLILLLLLLLGLLLLWLIQLSILVVYQQFRACACFGCTPALLLLPLLVKAVGLVPQERHQVLTAAPCQMGVT
jgi:maltodextrin utilization protein YvdJ